MKKLLNTLYVTSPKRYLSLDGENVVVSEEQNEIGRIPLHNLESIVTFGYTGASPALMGACAKRDINLTFLSGSGKFLARVSGEMRGNIMLRKEQYCLSANPDSSIKISRNCILGKVYNEKWILERACRDYPMRLDVKKIKEKSGFLSESMKRIKNCSDVSELRGLEGEAASVYFSVFDDLILQQKEDFQFRGRSRRPPLDAVNAMLSFAYVLLSGMCAGSLETVGLDPYAGFLHTDRPGRMSLALDMMEELRAPVADRFVLTLINKKIIQPDGFVKKENGAVMLDDSSRKIFLSHWQAKKQEVIRHPFLGEKVEWGMVPYVQAMLLARYIRGDLDEYPPFFWK
ncbi:MAG: type I-C CRISPR-associated endonuclease Cas1c [Lachnospiraceae bacterium]|nr:type I-C CRISPR-associated endonuclease Cas1c [Lachnospiraceae bacterium]